MSENRIPTRLILEVVRDSKGNWDTRNIDFVLGQRGAHIEMGILPDLRKVAERGLIREDNSEPRGTGPRWHLTDLGSAWLNEPNGEDT